MYSRHQPLTRLPFRLQPEVERPFESAAHCRVKSELIGELVVARNSALLVGCTGTGKTTLLKNVLPTLETEFQVVRINQPQLSTRELLQAVLLQLGQKASNATHESLTRTFERRLMQAAQQHERILVIIDDAQMMDRSTLEQALYLAEVGARGELALQVLLCGRPELRARFEAHSARADSHMGVCLELAALTPAEVEAYIAHRLAAAGCAVNSIFDADTFAVIHRHTSGIPKSINTLCDAALRDAHANPSCQVALSVVQNTVRKLSGSANQVQDDRDGQWRFTDAKADLTETCPQLVVIHKSRIVARINLLAGVLNIGRASENELQLPDNAVSRRHCRITTHGARSSIEDLASVNGLYINSRRMQSHALTNRDVVSLGDYKLIYRAHWK